MLLQVVPVAPRGLYSLTFSLQLRFQHALLRDKGLHGVPLVEHANHPYYDAVCRYEKEGHKSKEDKVNHGAFKHERPYERQDRYG